MIYFILLAVLFLLFFIMKILLDVTYREKIIKRTDSFRLAGFYWGMFAWWKCYSSKYTRFMYEIYFLYISFKYGVSIEKSFNWGENNKNHLLYRKIVKQRFSYSKNVKSVSEVIEKTKAEVTYFIKSNNRTLNISDLSSHFDFENVFGLDYDGYFYLDKVDYGQDKGAKYDSNGYYLNKNDDSRSGDAKYDSMDKEIHFFDVIEHSFLGDASHHSALVEKYFKKKFQFILSFENKNKELTLVDFWNSYLSFLDDDSILDFLRERENLTKKDLYEIFSINQKIHHGVISYIFKKVLKGEDSRLVIGKSRSLIDLYMILDILNDIYNSRGKMNFLSTLFFGLVSNLFITK